MLFLACSILCRQTFISDDYYATALTCKTECYADPTGLLFISTTENVFEVKDVMAMFHSDHQAVNWCKRASHEVVASITMFSERYSHLVVTLQEAW